MPDLPQGFVARGSRMFATRNVWTAPHALTTANWSNGTDTNGTTRSRHQIVYGPATDIQLIFTNTGQSGSSGHEGQENPHDTAGAETPAQMTLKAAIEAKVYGTSGFITFPVTFNGLATATVDVGGWAISDPCGIVLDANIAPFFYVRSFVTVASTKMWPLGINPLAVLNEGYLVNVDATGYNNALFTGYTQPANMWNVWGILGRFQGDYKPSVALIGDSNMTGGKHNQQNGSTLSNTTLDRGYFDNACGYEPQTDTLSPFSIPFFQGGRVGETALIRSSSRHTQRRNAMSGLATHWFICEGRNDVQNSDTLANITAYLTALCNQARMVGAKPILGTLFPTTTSGDNWATMSGQTLDAKNANRIAVNQWIRNTAVQTGVADGVIDLNANVECNSAGRLTQDGGYWLANGTTKYATADGVHPSFDGDLLIAKTIKDSVANGLFRNV